MTSYPGIRASDEDRERTAAALGGHYAAGRLTLEEFQERLDKAYAAKTLGELDDLMTDLPGTDPGQLPATRPHPSGGPPLPEPRAPGPVQAAGGGHYVILPLWLAVTLVIVLLSGAGSAPWFLWAAVVLAVITLRRRTVSGPHRALEHRDHDQDRP
jgi:hypothetical protein